MAENKTKAKKKKGKKPLFVIFLLVVAAFFVGVNIIMSNTAITTESETVLIGTAEDKTAVKGYIIRDEYVMNAPASGVISYRADEGERVSKGSAVAVIYSGEVSDEVKSELSSIHQRINEAEGSVVEKNLYAGDAMGGTSQIENDINMISEAVYSGNVTAVSQYKDDIIRIIRKDTAQGAEAQTTLEKLRARKSELESSISGQSSAMYAGMAGVMCSQIDGCEEYFGIKNLDKITPEYLKNAPQANPQGPETVEKDVPCLKIINNYEWYFTAQVDETWVEDMKAGSSVYLRFTDISDQTMSGTIYSISQPVKGKVAVVIKSRSLFTGMYTSRKLSAEIIRKTYKGFKVSKDAVHIDDDGNYYVYINSEGAVRRRDVQILYSDDAYVIIKEDNSASNNLLLYDEVIVSDAQVKDSDEK